ELARRRPLAGPGITTKTDRRQIANGFSYGPGVSLRLLPHLVQLFIASRGGERLLHLGYRTRVILRQALQIVHRLVERLLDIVRWLFVFPGRAAAAARFSARSTAAPARAKRGVRLPQPRRKIARRQLRVEQIRAAATALHTGQV